MNNTVKKTINILRTLSKDPGKTISEIAAELNLPKTTVFDIVHTLEEENILHIKNPREKTYYIGLEAYRIGYKYLDYLYLDDIVRPIISKLSEDIYETVFFAVRSGDSNIVYAMKINPNPEFLTIFSVGAVRHMLNTSLGKAMLAAMPDSEAVRICTPQMYSESTIKELTGPEALIPYLHSVRDLGFVMENARENPAETRVVAAPVMSADNQLLGSISINADYRRTSLERHYKLGEMVKQTALKTSNALGFMEDDIYINGRK